ncbi:MAG TPA: hypothetical protein VEW69_11460 [Alphaproteobacteria bacterium]|nr:hypothetical protein [Alphaproteobacteria bacterium]
MNKVQVIFTVLAVVCSGIAGLAQAGSPPSAKAADPERDRALALYEQHKMRDAAALLEKLVVKYPNDAVLHERLGAALVSRADTQTDPDLAKADRLRARAELLRAKALGDDSDLCRVLLAALPEDGGTAPFSDKKEVDAAMQRGEAAFAQGEYEAAIKEYSLAFQLDSKLYLAAVDIGDSYFRLKKVDLAGEWFARAIAIEPNAETAYRYWGDALLQDGQVNQARMKFIEGVVAYPYKATSWVGLRNWVTATQLPLKKIPIQIPAGPTFGPNNNTTININPASTEKPEVAAWLAYSMERVLWHNEKFAKTFPAEKAYRHSLQEEVSALSTAVTVSDEIQQSKKTTNTDPGLLMLAQFKKDGLLEAFVLLVHPDQGIAQDFLAYQKEHRDRLVEFMDKYVVPNAP